MVQRRLGAVHVPAYSDLGTGHEPDATTAEESNHLRGFVSYGRILVAAGVLAKWCRLVIA